MQITGFELLSAPDIHILRQDTDNNKSDTRNRFRNVVLATNAKDILDSQKKQCRNSENHLHTEKLAQGNQTTTIALPWPRHTERGARSAITFRKKRWEECKRQTQDPLSKRVVSWKTE